MDHSFSPLAPTAALDRPIRHIRPMGHIKPTRPVWAGWWQRVAAALAGWQPGADSQLKGWPQ